MRAARLVVPLLILALMRAVTAMSANLPTAQERLARGKYLVEGPVACGHCHTPKTAAGVPIASAYLSGAFVIEAKGVKVYAPNITVDPQTGIGKWSDAEIVRAIREGIRPDGSIMGALMPSAFYRGMTDTDVSSIVAYLRATKPIRNAVSRSHLPAPRATAPAVAVADLLGTPSRDSSLRHATYVAVTLAHCIGCHTPRVDGQRDFSRTGAGGELFPDMFGLGFTAVAANITSDPVFGLGAWTDEEIKRAITEGVGRGGRALLPVMPFQNYRNMTRDDLAAIVAYLRSLPPRRMQVAQ